MADPDYDRIKEAQDQNSRSSWRSGLERIMGIFGLKTSNLGFLEQDSIGAFCEVFQIEKLAIGARYGFIFTMGRAWF